MAILKVLQNFKNVFESLASDINRMFNIIGNSYIKKPLYQ